MPSRKAGVAYVTPLTCREWHNEGRARDAGRTRFCLGRFGARSSLTADERKVDEACICSVFT